jgi:hypothetical protein
MKRREPAPPLRLRAKKMPRRSGAVAYEVAH